MALMRDFLTSLTVSSKSVLIGAPGGPHLTLQWSRAASSTSSSLQSSLDNEGTNGEGTDGQYDDSSNSDVSATSGKKGAEASTPGAVARSGDPDEQAPVSGPQGDVVTEIPNSAPLPNTGGMSPLYWLVPLVGLLILAGLPVYRWSRRSSGR